MSNTFIFRPLVASEASRWSIISSFEARSPFVYSIRIPACSPTHRVRRNYQKAKGLATREGIVRAGNEGGQERRWGDPTVLFARGTRALRRASFDARS